VAVIVDIAESTFDKDDILKQNSIAACE